MTDKVKIFKDIFEGLDSAYGQTIKTDQFDERGKHKTKSYTVNQPPKIEIWKKHLEGVSADYWHGASRILEAAALAGLAENATDKGEKASLIETATEKLRRGYNIDTAYWDDIFAGGHDKHLGYTKPLEILKKMGLIKELRSSD